MNRLPKCYAIKCVDPKDPRWLRYIAYLNSINQQNNLQGGAKGYWCGVDKDGDVGYQSVSSNFGELLTLNQFDVIMAELVVQGKWYIRGCRELVDYIGEKKYPYMGSKDWVMYYPITPDFKKWTILRFTEIENHAEVTFEYFINRIVKPVVPTFDKDNWIVAVDTPEKKKEVAEWIDAQGSDGVKLVGHKHSYDNAYYGWKQGVFWATSNYNPYPELLITWEQFQRLKKHTMSSEKQAISRKDLNELYYKVSQGFQKAIKITTDKSPYAEEWWLNNLFIENGYKQANAEEKLIWCKFFPVLLLEKKNMLVEIEGELLCKISKLLFGAEILRYMSDNQSSEIPEIKGNALDIHNNYIVKTGPNASGGTWLTIHKKDI